MLVDFYTHFFYTIISQLFLLWAQQHDVNQSSLIQSATQAKLSLGEL